MTEADQHDSPRAYNEGGEKKKKKTGRRREEKRVVRKKWYVTLLINQYLYKRVSLGWVMGPAAAPSAAR
jgi:hypothetical protein